jgi:CysZ protein
MLDAALQALAQIFSPSSRAVLVKSVGLSLVLIVLFALGIHYLLAWIAGLGMHWAEGELGAAAHSALSLLSFVLSLATAMGIIAGSIFLMPVVIALTASFFVDDIAREVERSHYPDEPVGKALPPVHSLIEGVRTALLAIGVYLIALLLLLAAGSGALIFFFCTAFLLGREYFELAAMRYRPVAEAKRLRKMHRATVFLAGLLIAAFVSIPVVNLATPLFGMALMVHVHKRLSRSRPIPIKARGG